MKFSREEMDLLPIDLRRKSASPRPCASPIAASPWVRLQRLHIGAALLPQPHCDPDHCAGSACALCYNLAVAKDRTVA
jgi:hypothetical protein